MRLLRLHSPLIFTAIVMAALTLVSVGGLLFDDRSLLGVPIWLKPLKFSISILIYSVTLGWLLSLLDERRRRPGWWLGTVISLSLLLEMVVIVGQVLRGRQSHFNVGTPLDAALFSVMGATIMVVWVATAGIAFLLIRQRIADRPTAVAVRMGLLIALAGLGIGFLMTSPTAEQRAAMSQAPPAIVGAHSVGVPDGGAGLPLVNWSTEGGDLRAGHFIGMHALQALPLLALGLLLASRRIRRVGDPSVRARLVAVCGIGYGGLTALVTWQALRGQPLSHPDGLTGIAAAAVVLTVIIGTAWALRTRPAVEPPRAPDTLAGPIDGPTDVSPVGVSRTEVSPVGASAIGASADAATKVATR